MHAALGAADALGHLVVVLLRRAGYDPRFGLVPATTIGIEPTDPDWGDHVPARPLHMWRPELRGTFRDATPFDAR